MIHALEIIGTEPTIDISRWEQKIDKKLKEANTKDYYKAEFDITELKQETVNSIVLAYENNGWKCEIEEVERVVNFFPTKRKILKFVTKLDYSKKQRFYLIVGITTLVLGLGALVGLIALLGFILKLGS